MRRITVTLTLAGTVCTLVSISHAARLDHGPVELSKVDQCQRAEPRNFDPTPRIDSLIM